ncbi:MAG TPA: DUF5671 domain-containing protein [Candidatus Paceibacterota bacterium]
MEHHTKVTPYFFFITLGTLIALITSVSAFLNLVFETLNHVFPDVLTDSYLSGYYSYSFDGIRNSLALLIIVFPIYLILERLWRKASAKGLSLWSDTLRRWALYLILFLTSVTVIADLVTLVRYFVSGEITTRFILKVAVVLITAAMVGWYYVRRLKNPKPDRYDTAVMIKSVVLVLAAIVWAFSVIGGPGSQRTLRLDQKRLEDLQSIQWQVISYWQQTETLPTDLAALGTPLSGYKAPQDPEFEKGNAYEYRIVDAKANSFELCATFAAPLPKGWVTNGGGSYPSRDMATSSPVAFPGNAANEDWAHDVGRTCFTRVIDPVFYPPYPKEDARAEKANAR